MLFEYTDEMHKQDTEIATKKFYHKFAFFKNQKDDLIQIAVIHLWWYRMKYHDPTKAPYERVAPEIARQAMQRATRGEQRKFELNALELDSPINGYANITLAETITDTLQAEFFGQQKIDIAQTHNQVMSKFKNEKTQEIISLFMQGYGTKEIVADMKVTRQYVTRIKAKLKNVFIEISKQSS